MTARILVIQHVSHEGLGVFAPVLTRAHCSLSTLNVFDPKAAWPQPSSIQGLIVLGGPQSVYEHAAYPYLKKEMALLREAVERKLPILGVCLGAQVLAAALGAKVAKNPHKEIGWYPLMREPGADDDPLMASFGQTETVFQWHGDAFALPKGAVQLASSPLCDQQAFRYGDRAWGLQYHLEVTETMIRAWIRANAKELASLRGVIDPAAIRRQNAEHLPRMKQLAEHVASTFAKTVHARQCGMQNAECGIRKNHSALRTPHSALRSEKRSDHARTR